MKNTGKETFRKKTPEKRFPGRSAAPTCAAAPRDFCISLCAMLAEGLLLHHFGLQRHNSNVYFPALRHVLSVPPASRSPDRTESRLLRPFSTAVYILHPLCIIAVRGAAKFTGLTGLLIGNSIVHYLAVCLLSAAVSALCVFLFSALSEEKGASDTFRSERFRPASVRSGTPLSLRKFLPFPPFPACSRGQSLGGAGPGRSAAQRGIAPRSASGRL